MVPATRRIKLSDVKFDPMFYPRKAHDPALVQKYAMCLDEIEVRNNFISIASDGTLLDGRHRHLAYLKQYEMPELVDVPVYAYEITEPDQKFALAVELNSTHGHQLDDDDKKKSTLTLYGTYRYPLLTTVQKI